MADRARTLQTAIALVAAPILLAAIYPLQARIDAQMQPVQQERKALLLQSGPLLKRLSLRYDALLADIYWTRAVQYYGRGLADRDVHFELLAPLVNMTVTLDPHLIVAYRAGAIFLAEPPPAGPGLPDQAVNLVRRGIAANPDEFALWADLGFLYYWHFKDYPHAAEAYLEGSKNPRAPSWMRLMATRIAEQGGSRQTSRFLWTKIYESTKDPGVRQKALEHLRTLKVEEDADNLEKAATEFYRRFGRFPASLEDLVAARESSPAFPWTQRATLTFLAPAVRSC
jgi:tetratricopeptide (TPR) repeat protein